ncbi:MAG: GrpB family protein [Thermoplasmata archaeon]|nr:GrpB family protein [Thermoplasmata archaeon]
MTDDQIRQATIGEPAHLDGPVLLVEYDPMWPQQFARETERIQAALDARAIRVEHVGSTAVPGLVAKPIIDILLVVANSADESSYVPALEAAGYVLRHREPGWHEHRMFKGPDIDVNLHVFSSGSSEIGRMLNMRDRLRASRAARDLYAQTKRNLARRTWKYQQNYADAKAEVIEAILSGANRSSTTT